MEENYVKILESGIFNGLDVEKCDFTDAELRAITHLTIWENYMTMPNPGVDEKLLKYGRAVANEAIKRMSNK